MLCQFTVKNFRCFRDEITLDLQATPITENESTLIIDSDGERFLPLAVVYGPNAAGKSTVLSALYSLCLRIWRPICSVSCDDKSCKHHSLCKERLVNIPIEPFAFAGESANSPTEFELFFRTKTKEYQYQIKVYKNKVVFEALFQKRILGKRYSNVFIRNGKSISLKGTIKHYDVSDLSANLPLLSYLIITHSRNTIMKDISWWLETQIDFRNYGSFSDEIMFPVIESDDKKSIILSMLQEMDIDIDDYRTEESEGRLKRVFTSRVVDGKRTELNLVEESNGTIKILGLLPFLVNSIINGGTLVIDELDAKLHPFLLKYIIELYNNPKTNKNGAQLVFTSHDLTTMNSDCFRRDEIWYVAKTRERGAKLYSLVEFARKDARFDKQYLEGKYGACPYLQRIINWEEVQ